MLFAQSVPERAILTFLCLLRGKMVENKQIRVSREAHKSDTRNV